MPDPTQPIKPSGVSDPAAPATSPSPEDQGGDKKPVPYSRFAEVNERAKAAEDRLAKIDAAARENAEAEALARGEHEKVIAGLRGDLEKAQAEKTDLILQNEVKLAALKEGAHDPNDVLPFLAGKVRVENGAVVGLTESIAELKTQKAYLFGKPAAPAPGAPPAAPAHRAPGVTDTTEALANARAQKDPVGLLLAGLSSRQNGGADAGPDARR